MFGCPETGPVCVWGNGRKLESVTVQEEINIAFKATEKAAHTISWDLLFVGHLTIQAAMLCL